MERRAGDDQRDAAARQSGLAEQEGGLVGIEGALGQMGVEIGIGRGMGWSLPIVA
jgi:hypothetical protein